MMIDSNKPTGAIAALLDEYKKAIDELIVVITPLSSSQLTRIIDPNATDTDCRSIQTILSHVVSSSYSYSVYIENWIGINTTRPDYFIGDEIAAYIEKLNLAFNYCENLFIKNPTIVLEEFNNDKKINTRWGQQYDVDQLMEHAIVHVLRHRRQIKNIIKHNF